MCTSTLPDQRLHKSGTHLEPVDYTRFNLFSNDRIIMRSAIRRAAQLTLITTVAFLTKSFTVAAYTHTAHFSFSLHLSTCWKARSKPLLIQHISNSTVQLLLLRTKQQKELRTKQNPTIQLANTSTNWIVCLFDVCITRSWRGSHE